MAERDKLSIEERAEEFPEISSEIPVEVENKGVVTPTPGQFKAQVTDDRGQPLIQTPGTPVTITLPESLDRLTTLSKGNPEEAASWFGAIWLMNFKRAVYFGWKVITGGKQENVA